MLHNPKYRADIDGLRALAVLMVLVFHAFPQSLSGGFVGVDVFFVISGFLISSILYQDLESANFSFLRFYEKRTLRIMPALLLVLFCSLIFAWFFLLSFEFANFSKHLVATLAYVSNFVLKAEINYFSDAAESKPLLHMWSLSIEEQFYLLFPLLCYVSYRFVNRNIQRLKFVLGLLAVLSFSYAVFYTSQVPAKSFFSFSTRAWELFAGALLGSLNIKQVKIQNSKTASLLSLFGLALLLVAAVFFDASTPFPGVWALVPIVGSVLLIGAGEGAWINRQVLSQPWVRYIGKISYPLYLWHWVVFSYIYITSSDVDPSTYNSTVVMGFVLCFVLAAATYEYFEKPLQQIHRQGQWGRGWFIRGWGGVAHVLVLCQVVLFACVLVVYQRQGFPHRFAEFEKSIAGSHYYFGATKKSPAQKECQQIVGIKNTFCQISSPQRPVDVALIGDSLANQYWPGLESHYKEKNLNLGLLAIDATAGFWGCQTLKKNEEARDNTTNLEWIAKQSSVKTVVLAFSDYLALKDFSFLDRAGIPISYESCLDQTLSYLSSQKKQIVFILKNPQQDDFKYKACTDLRPRRLRAQSQPALCGIPQVQHEQRQAAYREATLPILARYPQVRVFDPAAHLCQDGICRASVEGFSLYSHDDIHLSIDGSRWVSRFF